MLKSVDVNTGYSHTWQVEVNKTVNAVEENGTLSFIVNYDNRKKRIPCYNIVGLPSININAQIVFLSSTWVKLLSLGEDEWGLNINSRLLGGGNITRDPSKLWPDGLVPYEIDIHTYLVNGKARQSILDTIKIWNTLRTGLRFIPRTIQNDVLVFSHEPQAVYFQEGYQGGAQYIYCTLHDKKVDKSRLLRDMGRAVGLEEEYRRSDRDEHLTIIFPQEEDAMFAADNMFGPFDWFSIMQERINTSVAEGPQIVTPITLPQGEANKVGRAENLSVGDIAAVRYLYPLQLRLGQTSCIMEARRTAEEEMPYILSSSRLFSRQVEWKTLYDHGSISYTKGAFEKAKSDYKVLIKEYRHYLPLTFIAELYHSCGVCCFYLKAYIEAEKWYRLALVLIPEHKIFLESNSLNKTISDQENLRKINNK